MVRKKQTTDPGQPTASKAENREKRVQSLLACMLLFLFGSFLGWIWEELYCSALAGEWVKRGFLHGPYLPIYGCGCLIVTYMKKLLGKYPPLFFLGSVVACGTIEYATSLLLEMIYHRRWWDYSDHLANLNGRICLGELPLFGLAGILFAYFLLPMVRRVTSKIPYDRLRKAIFIIFALFVVDVGISVFTNFR